MPLSQPAGSPPVRHLYRLFLAFFVLTGIAAATQDPLVVLHEFRAFTGGAVPNGPLLQASDKRLYGVTAVGGGYGNGTLYSLAAGGSGHKTLVDFDATDSGARPVGHLLEGSDGRLYGVTQTGGGTIAGGGTLEVGTIYSVKRNGSDLRVLHRFDPATTGSNPRDGVIELPDGRLYGTTGNGGTLPGGGEGGGTVYSLKRDGTDFRVLHVFAPGTDGSRVFSRLTRGSDGRLYGVATEGGTGGHGTAFAIQPNGSNFVVLHHFQSTQGGPRGALYPASDGNLYGVTRHRTVNVPPYLYRITPGTGVLTWLLQFPVAREIGISPVIEGRDGRLYGTAVREGLVGFLFVVNKDGSGFVNLGGFGPGSEPSAQLVALTLTSANRLFGVDDGVPEEAAGEVYSLRPDGTDFRIAHEFDFISEEGFRPQGLNAGTDGRLYGITRSGGEFGEGTIYSIKTNGTGFKVLHDADPDNEGSELAPTLVRGGGGKWFGTTNLEAAGGGGTLFSFLPDRRRLTILHVFQERLGTQNDMVLELGADNWIYGYLFEESEVFAIRTNGSGFITLVDGLGDAGVGPTGVIEISKGLVVGVMREGGAHDRGIVFSVRRNGSDFRIEQNLGANPDDPHNPHSLMQASNGLLYGGSSTGVFVIDPATRQARRLPLSGDPNAADGGGYLLEASDGRIYAVTNNGGAHGQGVWLSFDPDGKTAAVHHDFSADLNAPQAPRGPTAEGRDGRLYGASLGGQYRAGVLFALARVLRIVAQPEDVDVPSGQPAELRVGASGPGPLEFRWFRNGKRVRNADEAVLAFSAVKPSDAGTYHVEVRARGKKVVSESAQLVVASP